MGAPEIVVVGDLALKLKKSKKLALLGSASIAVLTIALGTATAVAPMTGGLSYFAAAPIATLTGAEIVAIVAAASVGLTLVLAVFKDYEEISYENGKMVLRKKSKR